MLMSPYLACLESSSCLISSPCWPSTSISTSTSVDAGRCLKQWKPTLNCSHLSFFGGNFFYFVRGGPGHCLWRAEQEARSGADDHWDNQLAANLGARINTNHLAVFTDTNNLGGRQHILLLWAPCSSTQNAFNQILANDEQGGEQKIAHT